MKKCVSCFLAIFLLLSLGSCAAPLEETAENSNEMVGDSNETAESGDEIEFFCYTYPDAGLERGEKMITDEPIAAAYWAYQEKSEYVLPETRTAHILGKEYTVTLDPTRASPSTRKTAYYALRDENGKTRVSVHTDYYGNETETFVATNSEEYETDGDFSRIYDVEELRKIAIDTAAEHWEGIFDIRQAETDIRIWLTELGVNHYWVTFNIFKNGYVAANPRASIDHFGNVTCFIASGMWSDMRYHSEQYPDLDTEKMREAADLYAQKWFPAPEKQTEKDKVTVKLVEFFNGKFGLYFNYKRTDPYVMDLAVIVTTEEYSGAVPFKK